MKSLPFKDEVFFVAFFKTTLATVLVVQQQQRRVWVLVQQPGIQLTIHYSVW